MKTYNYFVTGVYKNWKSDIGTFGVLIKTDFDVKTPDEFAKLITIVSRSIPRSGESDTGIEITRFELLLIEG